MSFGKRSVFGGGVAGGGGRGGAEGQSLALNLTALMDILSNLLFFLLASYTAQSVEIQQKADIQLPSSSSQVNLTPSLTITVTKSRIDVSGLQVGTIANNVITEPLDAAGNITGLHARLRNVKASRIAAGRGDLADAETVLVLADKQTDADIITKVLKTAGQAGFINVKFGVISQ